jgi:plastocyanin
MSLFHDSLRAFAAGAAVCCVVCAATALPAETRASIDNFTFKPDTITVPVGTTVVWENDDNIVHTVVSRDGAFRSPALDTEDKFRRGQARCHGNTAEPEPLSESNGGEPLASDSSNVTNVG